MSDLIVNLSAGDRQLIASWDRPTNDDFTIAYYEVEYRISTTTSYLNRVSKGSPTQTSHTLTN